MIAPELMGPCRHSTQMAQRMPELDSSQVLFTPLDPLGDEAEDEFNKDLSRPRKVHF